MVDTVPFMPRPYRAGRLPARWFMTHGFWQRAALEARPPCLLGGGLAAVDAFKHAVAAGSPAQYHRRVSMRLGGQALEALRVGALIPHPRGDNTTEPM